MIVLQNIMMFLNHLISRFKNCLAHTKYKMSPEILSAIAKGAIIESGVEIYTTHPGTIKLGNHIHIGRNTVISNYEGRGCVCVGDNTSIGWNNNFYCQGGLRVGSNVLFASNVCVLTSNHGFTDIAIPIKQQVSEYGAVEIGDDSWIGYNAIILPGVKIGRHVVIGAGSVVTHDMPDYSVCAGSPCKVIRFLQ